MCCLPSVVLLLCSPSAEQIKFGLVKFTNSFQLSCPGLARSSRPPSPCLGDKDGSGLNSSLYALTANSPARSPLINIAQRFGSHRAGDKGPVPPDLLPRCLLSGYMSNLFNNPPAARAALPISAPALDYCL